MATRLELHEDLCTVLGSRNCYFQPPSNLKLQYDCFVYKLTGIDVKRADNLPYHNTKRYEVVAIFKDPDSDYMNRMLKSFKMCRFENAYVADNLYHQVFELYY